MIMRTTVALSILLLSTTAVPAQEQPNIVVMLVDNLGWGELGSYGGGVLRGAETPRLDTLAAEGMRFLNFNVEPQCTPSRSALMTGRHPIRSGTTKVVWGMLYGMTQWERTIAELLSDEGYATGMFGKWHLGDTQGRFPTDQGFDEWYGIANTTDEAMYSSHYAYDPDESAQPYVVDAKKGETPRKVKVYNLDARRLIDGELTDRTIAFMQKTQARVSPSSPSCPSPTPICRHWRTPISPARRGTGTTPTCSPRSITAPDRSWMRSTTLEFERIRLSCG